MDGEGVEVVGQDRPAGPNPLSLVAFEAAAPQPAAAFEVAAAALGAGAKSGPGAGGCAWSQARCVQRRCVTRRQGMAKLRSLSGLRSPWQAHRTRRPTAGSSAPRWPARTWPARPWHQGAPAERRRPLVGEVQAHTQSCGRSHHDAETGPTRHPCRLALPMPHRRSQDSRTERMGQGEPSSRRRRAACTSIRFLPNFYRPAPDGPGRPRALGTRNIISAAQTAYPGSRRTPRGRRLHFFKTVEVRSGSTAVFRTAHDQPQRSPP